MTQLDFFTYTEAQTLSEGEYCALETLWHNWRAADPQFWFGRDGLPDAKGHERWIKLGGSEWRPVDHPAHYFPRAAVLLLAERGWAEVEVRAYFKQQDVECVRITRAGIEAHFRHADACFRATNLAKPIEPTKRKRR